jgi:hypothetical protein
MPGKLGLDGGALDQDVKGNPSTGIEGGLDVQGGGADVLVDALPDHAVDLGPDGASDGSNSDGDIDAGDAGPTDAEAE